jgi:hypothetical protein
VSLASLWYCQTTHYQNTEDFELSKSYIELLKEAGNVRRPVHSQAVALILLCRTNFGNERHRTAENALSLEPLRGLPESQFVPARAISADEGFFTANARNERLNALTEAATAATESKIWWIVSAVLPLGPLQSLKIVPKSVSLLSVFVSFLCEIYDFLTTSHPRSLLANGARKSSSYLMQ